MGAPSYLALLRVEFARFTPTDGLRRRPASSLWHWSSPHGGRALPATLRCGARTFLTPPTGHPIDDARPSDRLADRPILASAGIEPRRGDQRRVAASLLCAAGTERASPGAGTGTGGARRSQRSTSARAPSSSRMPRAVAACCASHGCDAVRRPPRHRSPRGRIRSGLRGSTSARGPRPRGRPRPGAVPRVPPCRISCRDASLRRPRRGSTWLRTPRSPRWHAPRRLTTTAARIASG